MGNLGWIKLHRKIMESAIFSNKTKFKVWAWILMKANHEKAVFAFNDQDVELLPGQFITGREKACLELGDVTSQQWRTATKYLKSTSRITTKPSNKYTIITVCNWNKYQLNNQLDDQPLTNNQPATSQPITTNNKDKNENNENKEKNISTTSSETRLVKVDNKNPDTEFLISSLKETLELPMLDGSDAENRRFCNLMLEKFGGREKVEAIFEAAGQDEFWRNNISSFKDLYYKAVKIVARTRKTSKIVFIDPK